MSDWTVRATIAGVTYTANRADAPGEATLPCLYSCSWRHELEDDDQGWPRRRAITTATVQLLVADAADAAHIGPQLTVFLEFITGGDTVDWFAGRASYPTIEVHELGAIVTVDVAHYLVDLAGFEVGDAAYPAESHGDRLERVMPAWSLGTSWAMALAARAISPVSLLDYLRELFATGANRGTPSHLPPVWRLYELFADVDPTTGELDPVMPWTSDRMDPIVTSEVPLKLREAPDLPGVWELFADPADPDTAPWVIDGTCVQFDATWTRRTESDANTVHIVLADNTVVTGTNALPGEVVVAFTVETELTDPADAAALADAYLPQRSGDGISSQWSAEAFTVLLDETEAGWYVPPSVNEGYIPPRVTPLRTLVALSDIQRRHHPDGATYMAGVVTALGLSVANGTARLEVQLEGHESFYGGAFDDPYPVKLSEVPSGVTIDSLHDSVTFDAIALARD